MLTVYPKMKRNTRTLGIELSFVRGLLSEQAFWRILQQSSVHSEHSFSTDYKRAKHCLTIDWIIHLLTRLSSALWFKINLNMIMVLAGADLRQGGLPQPSKIPGESSAMLVLAAISSQNFTFSRALTTTEVLFVK